MVRLVTGFPVACDPQLDDNCPVPPPTSDDVTFYFEYDADNPNIVHFTNTSRRPLSPSGDLGNGGSGGR